MKKGKKERERQLQRSQKFEPLFCESVSMGLQVLWIYVESYLQLKCTCKSASDAARRNCGGLSFPRYCTLFIYFLILCYSLFLGFSVSNIRSKHKKTTSGNHQTRETGHFLNVSSFIIRSGVPKQIDPIP